MLRIRCTIMLWRIYAYFPSIYEPFGIVALEAAAMGKAAVVGAAGTSGLAEIVKNPADSRPTGVHVNARDSQGYRLGH